LCILRELIKLIPRKGHLSSVFWHSFVAIRAARWNKCAEAGWTQGCPGGWCRQGGAHQPHRLCNPRCWWWAPAHVSLPG